MFDSGGGILDPMSGHPNPPVLCYRTRNIYPHMVHYNFPLICITYILLLEQSATNAATALKEIIKHGSVRDCRLWSIILPSETFLHLDYISAVGGSVETAERLRRATLGISGLGVLRV